VVSVGRVLLVVDTADNGARSVIAERSDLTATETVVQLVDRLLQRRPVETGQCDSRNGFTPSSLELFRQL
jgi:hypothetical protein